MVDGVRLQRVTGVAGVAVGALAAGSPAGLGGLVRGNWTGRLVFALALAVALFFCRVSR